MKQTSLILLSAFALAACATSQNFTASEETGYKLYRQGHYDRAIQIWKNAAQNGDIGAAFRLYEEYMDAKVVKRDIPLAVSYLQTSAQGGDRRAQMDMGTLHDNGQGLPFSKQDAAQWYLASARQGLPEAQYNVAVMFETGEGIQKNLPQAYRFYNLAIRNNFIHFAKPALEKLVITMTPQEIQQGEALLKMKLQ